jgi:pilus assembly protein Flp/PilA
MRERRQRGTGNQLATAAFASLRAMAGDDAGVTAIEYAFIAGLVAIVVVAAVTTLGTGVSGLFNSVLGGF